MTQLIINGEKGGPTLILAHGAGSAMDSDFMDTVSIGIAAHGIQVIRFEFPYMQIQRETGKRRPPDRQPKLIAHFNEVINGIDADKLFVGGKSMGGRMASIAATETTVTGVVVMGYPFHALGKPEKVRVDHFCDLKVPLLVFLGERDAMGNSAEVAQYRIPGNIQVNWLSDGDHDLKPRKSSGLTQQEHLNTVIDQTSRFIHENSAP